MRGGKAEKNIPSPPAGQYCARWACLGVPGRDKIAIMACSQTNDIHVHKTPRLLLPRDSVRHSTCLASVGGRRNKSSTRRLSAMMMDFTDPSVNQISKIITLPMSHHLGGRDAQDAPRASTRAVLHRYDLRTITEVISPRLAYRPDCYRLESQLLPPPTRNLPTLMARQGPV